MDYDEREARLNALKQLLLSTDYQSIKHSEGLISDEQYAPTREQRQAWRVEVNALEAAIAKESSE
jgi:hypothetical protein